METNCFQSCRSDDVSFSLYLLVCERSVLHLTRGAPGDALRGSDFVTDAVLHSVRALTHLEDLSVAGQSQVRTARDTSRSKSHTMAMNSCNYSF
jgi:hypothetical protein